MRPSLLLAFLTSTLLLIPSRAWTQSTCDADKSCVGNALQFTGGDLDYVDVFNTPVLSSIDSTRAFSLTLWVHISRQPGVTQYIGGVWGPRVDRDDRWLLYVDPTDSLTFELSNGTTDFGRFDNTVVKTSMIYGAWIHIAVMWDGASETARIVIDGRTVATSRNPDYPISALRQTVSYLQFGSFNGQSNDPVNHKTLTGTLDEIRLWNRVIPDAELLCNRFASLQGNEPGLILYLRCNETGGDVLCDASRFNGRGNRRGGLQFVPGTRTVAQSVFITPQSFALPLGCQSDTTLTVSITDTSSCNQTVFFSLSGKDASSFSLAASSFTLQQNQPFTLQIRTNIRITGQINAVLTIRPLNSCNPTVNIPIDITRRTQLAVSLPRVTFDTLFGCVNKTTSDTTLRLCNESGGPLTINSLPSNIGPFSFTPVGFSLPLTLNPGQCVDVMLRFAPPDTGSYSDTLRISSTDICPGSGLVPLFGRRVDIARLTITSANFDQPMACRRSLNLTREFFLRNFAGENFTVETIEFSNSVFSSPTVMPFTARPGIAYRMYIRFRSNVEGYYTDTARVRMNFRGCIVYKNIPLAGRIVDVKLTPQDTLVNFGTVTVGQSATLPISISNIGLDTRDVFVYLSSGRVFSLGGANRFTVTPTGTQSVSVTFRPLAASFYRDTLYFQDVGCSILYAVILEGNGIFGSLIFDPGYLQAGNVINCRCSTDTVRVTNNTGGSLTLRSVTISGSTKFTFLPPLPSANEVLAANETRMFVIRYCPNGAPDFVTEVADLVFDTDGPEGVLRLLLRGTNIEPKLTIDPVTNYGSVEVGTSQVRVLQLTNPSPTPVRVDSFSVSGPFTIVNAVPPLGSTLQYRDTMLVTVQFSPPSNATYNGQIRALSNTPCPINTSGSLTGQGIIVPLFVPWSTVVFSEATRCDSVVRIVGLVNDGSVPIRVDSIWIIGRDSVSFTWRGRTFNGQPPRDVPAMFADSIDIIYHPNRSQNVQSIAQIKIAATTRLGQQIFTINLVGGRIQQFIPNRNLVAFPTTAVRNTSGPVSIAFQNPSYLETLYIDSISFVPDQRVFATSGVLPLVIPPRQTRIFQFYFSPRAGLLYTAKIRLVTRVKCVEIDTTISITGDGYTPPWLTSICIDSSFTANIGDILRLPVMLNRSIPQNPLDIHLFVGFHRRALQYIGFEPVFTTSPVRDTLQPDGVRISLRANQNVTAGPIGYITFRVAASDSMQFLMRTDSIGFTSDSVIALALFADGCDRIATVNPKCGITRMEFSESRYELGQCYPNPTGNLTRIEYETMEDTPLRIDLRDTAGRIVAVLVDTFHQHGRYVLTPNASTLASGVYSYMMQTPNFTATRTMVVIK